jgi:hypothetical protein
MADDDSLARWLLIVVGSTLRAEEADRPLAYYLKQQVESALEAVMRLDHGAGGPFRVAVIADFRWLRDEPLQKWPTLSIGGPGVNLLTHHWLEEVPLSLAVDNQYYIQMDPDLDEPRVSIWGMDNASTQIAVSAFLQRFSGRFLEHIVHTTPAAASPDAESESEESEEDDDD